MFKIELKLNNIVLIVLDIYKINSYNRFILLFHYNINYVLYLYDITLQTNLNKKNIQVIEFFRVISYFFNCFKMYLN